MRHMMTYEGLFDFLKKKVERTDSDAEIINTCEDILLELSDMYGGYTNKIEGYRRHKGNILLKKPDQNKYLNEIDIKIMKPIPNNLTHDVVKQFHIMDIMFQNEIKPIYDRLSDYLKSQGFKLKQYNFDYVTNPMVWAFKAK